MKVYDQLCDTLAGECLHSRFDVALELVKVVGLESANIHLDFFNQRGSISTRNCAAYCSSFTIGQDVRFDSACATRNRRGCWNILLRQADGGSMS